jgi:hypothetical protein
MNRQVPLPGPCLHFWLVLAKPFPFTLPMPHSPTQAMVTGTGAVTFIRRFTATTPGQPHAGEDRFPTRCTAATRPGPCPPLPGPNRKPRDGTPAPPGQYVLHGNFSQNFGGDGHGGIMLVDGALG